MARQGALTGALTDGRWGTVSSEATPTSDAPGGELGWFANLATRPAAATFGVVGRILDALTDPEVPEAGDDAVAARYGTGTERPEELPPHAGPTTVQRSFAFVDLSGFTAYTDTHGERAAVELLALFRLLVSEVAARRGVRVAKWLGDGAMIVGVEPAPTVATVVELLGRFQATDLTVRAGLASGPTILFQADDYIGRCVNLASRLCDAATGGEVLATADIASTSPDWVRITKTRTLHVKGVGRVNRVSSLELADDVALPVPH